MSWQLRDSCQEKLRKLKLTEALRNKRKKNRKVKKRLILRNLVSGNQNLVSGNQNLVSGNQKMVSKNRDHFLNIKIFPYIDVSELSIGSKHSDEITNHTPV